jgi:hypothetical protein
MIVGNYTYTTIAAGTGDEAGIAAAAGLRLMGYSVRETAGSAATLNLCHGTDGTTVMAPINLASAGSDAQWFGPQGLPCDSGVWVERLTGTSQVILITTIA